MLDAQKQAEIRRLATDFPSIWSHPATANQDKKRMVRLLIEDVTLKRDGYSVTLFIRFKAGALLTRMVRLSRSGNKATVIDPGFHRLHRCTHRAATPLAKSLPSSMKPVWPTLPGATLTPTRWCICSSASSSPRVISGCAQEGMSTQEEIAEKFSVTIQTVQRWHKCGWIYAEYYNDQKEYLYEPFLEGLPQRYQDFGCQPMAQSCKEE